MQAQAVRIRIESTLKLRSEGLTGQDMVRHTAGRADYRSVWGTFGFCSAAFTSAAFASAAFSSFT